MNWRQKALVQRIVSSLPDGLDYRAHYWMQRSLGALRAGANVPTELRKATLILKEISARSSSVLDSEILEIGAGRTLNTEIGLWLCGCRKIIAVDLNPYLAEELVSESLDWMKNHPEIVRQTLISVVADEVGFEDRLSCLLKSASSASAVRALISLEYLAPADARKLDLPSASIDFHISTNVLEHVPQSEIRQILLEARRILKPDGLLVHRIDLSDHFAHSDRSISSVNFLQFDRQQWARLSDNKFAFHNRLRASDFRALFADCGIEIIGWEEELDREALALLLSRFPLHSDFEDYSKEDLAVHLVTFSGRFTEV